LRSAAGGALSDGNTRTLEIERTLSLAQLAPGALEELKRTGACDFYLSEALFDYDFPGHYARKVKSISLSIPAVVGPYQNVKATLTQTQNWIATNNQFAGTKYLLGLDQKSPTPPPANSGVRVGWASDQQIALSRGMDDSGLFTLDFHDERYLPFEGTGVVSNWHLEMPLETNRFDFAQLSDVIITGLDRDRHPNDRRDSEADRAEGWRRLPDGTQPEAGGVHGPLAADDRSAGDQGGPQPERFADGRGLARSAHLPGGRGNPGHQREGLRGIGTAPPAYPGGAVWYASDSRLLE
jgi:hypothetical protein